MRSSCLTGIIAATVLASPAMAQERYFNFAVRGGVIAAPSYPGASNYEALPDLGLTFGALKWGRVDVGEGIGAIPANGISFRGAFRVIGARELAENPELVGLTDVDTAVELGFGVNYQQTDWRAFGVVRKGITGHYGVTGNVGADVIFRPDDRLTITAGPRVSFGDGEYASTYFGVSAAEAGTFSQFDASGGALGAGFAVQANYDLNDRWSVNGLLGYEKLIGDAGDSPITAVGSDDQWSISIGLSREFTLRF